MPRYYFDTSDNGEFTRDDVGTELPDDEAARERVGKILPDVARLGLPDGDIHSFECTVRNEAGESIYSAEMTYHGRRLGSSKP